MNPHIKGLVCGYGFLGEGTSVTDPFEELKDSRREAPENGAMNGLRKISIAVSRHRAIGRRLQASLVDSRLLVQHGSCRR